MYRFAIMNPLEPVENVYRLTLRGAKVLVYGGLLLGQGPAYAKTPAYAKAPAYTKTSFF